MHENKFSGGPNIALKIPKSKYEACLTFYRDILGLEVEERPISNPTVSRTHQVNFGLNVLWLDCVDNYSRTDTWLELQVDNVEKAIDRLATKGVATQNELEETPENMHWITDPAGNVFLVTDKE